MRTAALHHPRRLAAGVLVVVVLAIAAAVALIPQAKATCSSFGTTWARTYDRHAVQDQNPIRIISACCKPTNTANVSSCFLTVGQAGISEHGCELVDISSAGLVASEGVHENCT